MKKNTLISLVAIFTMLLIFSSLLSAEANKKQEVILIHVTDVMDFKIIKMIGGAAELFVGDPDSDCDYLFYHDFVNEDGCLVQEFTINDELFFSIRRSSSEVQVDIPNQLSATLFHETGEYISMFLGDPECEHIMYSEFTDENDYFVQEFTISENIVFSVKRKAL
jgi:hypothetical protein